MPSQGSRFVQFLQLQDTVTHDFVEARGIAGAVIPVLEALGAALQAGYLGVWTRAPSGRTLELLVGITRRGDDTPELGRSAFRRGQGLIGRAWQEACACHAEQADAGLGRLLREHGASRAVAVPVPIDGHIEIVLAFFACDVEASEPSTLDLLTSIGRQLGGAIARLHSESARSESDAFKAAFLRGSPDAIIVVDSAGCIVEWSASAERMFGWRAEEVLGKPTLETIVPAELAAEGQFFGRDVATNGQTVETRLLTASGSTLPVAVGAHPVDIGGRSRACAFVRDLSDRKQIEERLAHALRKAESENRRQADFLAVLAHELRNPLAALVTASEILDPQRPESVERVRGVVRRQTSHLTRLVDDLLDTARLSHGKLRVELQPLELDEAIQAALEMTETLFRERSHQLHLRVDRGLWVEADRARLTQVLQNLMTNAGRYTPPGGNVWVTAERERDMCIVSVADDGVGMRPETLDVVFQPFVQGESGHDSRGGLGLGLALVKSLVDLHGGSVEARSAGLGCGSRFTVRLPSRGRRH